MAGSQQTNTEFRLYRESKGIGGALRRIWRRWWVKALAILAALGTVGLGAAWAIFARDLPSVDKLRAYEPRLPSYVRGVDGMPIHSYARERSVQLSFAEYPPLLIKAYLAAEDKTFFEHHGVDFGGVAGAVVDYVTKFGTGHRAKGGSTITQQVAKNLLIGNEYSPTRKVKEAILAYRIENALSKQQILELYLNSIFLGRQAYGVEAAGHAYFDKELPDLKLSQMAYLAILPKGPSNYDPDRDTDRALERRNYVLGEMLKNGFITQAQHDEAVRDPLGTVNRHQPTIQTITGYFIEEVRRQLLDKFGQTEADGPYSVYNGGLWVRTSYDQHLQDYAQEALRNGLIRYDSGRGWNGPLAHKEITAETWRNALLASGMAIDYKDWRVAIVIAKEGGSATIGFANGETGTMPSGLASTPVRGVGVPAFGRIEPGDILAVAPMGGSFALRSIPKISGGMVIEEPATGRVFAMQGGFESRIDTFNRATQAERQPGSTIKPIVYSSALENGMTPASIIIDGPFCVYQSAQLGTKCFKNFGGGGGSGPHTMRWGIEQSRNLMTVRAAAQTGMDHVVNMMKRLDVGTYPPYLAFALGAGETTVSKMVNAYTVIANQGRWHPPSLIDFVQDRHGKVIWPENWRPCDNCNMPDWDGKPMPRPLSHARQALDAQTAYQMVHIAEGVVQRGTAVGLRDLDRPMMGKTGTTTGPTDVWFIGGTPQMMGGLYIGYDKPVSLGGYAQGGTLAVPIFKEFALKAFADMEKIPFRAAPGIRMVRIDRASGKPVYGTWPGTDPKAAVIWEAFKPESEPRRTARPISDAADRPKDTAAHAAGPARARSDSDFLQKQGGIY